MDKYGRHWDIPSDELCPTCGQPDSCGDCNHEKLDDAEVRELGGRLVKPDFRLVVIDETRYMGKEYKNAEHIERIESVYLYDRALYVHLCELTPSYELWPIETRAVVKEGVSEELRETIWEETMASAYYRIEYVHASTIDRMESYSLERLTPTDSDESYEEIRNSLIEYCQGNTLA